MKNKRPILVLLWLFSASEILAHALWIETKTNGTAGKAQEVKIFYGEYADGKIEAIEDWYSDVKEFKLWLVNPDNQKTELKCSPHGDHFIATFIPDKEGVYTLAIKHSAKDLGGTYIYQFNSSASVFVGKPSKENIQLPAENEIYVKLDKTSASKVNGTIKGHVFFNGSPAAEVILAVASPAGWSKNFTTDENGFFEFTALWQGAYMLEASFTEDKTGEHHGKPYEHIWRCATVLTSVGP